ncbi:YlxR family protein [Aquihabitans sp. G128]|uniref:YlxR family protein n=1 Tax=Aquihabitans sp. G128 TaxID=2849779 RepID=UPI001C23B096|nr:YlxR family protein [Aquihabitans sp. G128]
MARPAEPGPGPRRTCIGCRRVRPPAELTRFVRSDDRSLQIGRTLAGRGAWLCQGSTECFERAARQGGLRPGLPGPGRGVGARRPARRTP